ncbi:unnamed protein product [Blepharisma stoltei]|uniref:Rab-GAP TBC domain-containing protein n=1 Tax=Blepharisma stoltei TaxID=1481888 RepID=A0AAU9J6Y5_9CILI|nr:unnamed protein product [Blepharisma stoltei]
MGAACCGSKVLKHVRVADVSRVPMGMIPPTYQTDQDIENNWNKELNLYQDSNNPISTFKEQNFTKFRSLIYNGTPKSLRFEIWQQALNINSDEISVENLLDSNLSTSLSDIEKDITRTFPANPLFSTELGQKTLKEVLLAFANHRPNIGYCQGMNYIAATFLITCNGDRNSAFYIMNCVLSKFGAERLFEKGFPLVKELCSKFHNSLRSAKPNIEAHILKHNFDDALWLTKWFITMFTYSFSYETVVRFWDGVFTKGIRFMINISLAIVEMIESEILKRDLPLLSEYFSGIGQRYLNIDLIMKNALKYDVQIDNNDQAV